MIITVHADVVVILLAYCSAKLCHMVLFSWFVHCNAILAACSLFISH